MANINLKNLGPDDRAALQAVFKEQSKDKIIIYVEDQEVIGKPTSQLLQLLADSTAEVKWVKTAEDGLKLVEQLCKDDPTIAHRMILITDDQTGGSLDGQALIRQIHNKQETEMKTMPAVLFTGFSLPAEGIEQDVITVMDSHTVATGKPFNIFVIASAINLLEKNRDKVQEAALKSTEERKAPEYEEKSDKDLETIVHKGESFFHSMKARQQHHDANGPFVARSDPKFWPDNPDDRLRRSEERIWKEQVEDTLEAIGYARAEQTRRAAQRTKDLGPDSPDAGGGRGRPAPKTL